MCWSGQASGVLAAIGIGTTVYAAYKKEAAPLWLALGYFSLMELLQAATYTVINLCGIPLNQVLTLLGYVHIAFQPFFVSALSMYFIPKNVAAKIAPWVYALCFASAVVMLIQLYPFEWAEPCGAGYPLCGERLCSVRGTWHIAWEVPISSFRDFFYGIPVILEIFPTYVLMVFIVPVLYGSWRITLYHLICGPLLAVALTRNPNEWPAVWCLLSIGILLIMVKTPLRQILFVRSWPTWRWIGEPTQVAAPEGLVPAGTAGFASTATPEA